MLEFVLNNNNMAPFFNHRATTQFQVHLGIIDGRLRIVERKKGRNSLMGTIYSIVLLVLFLSNILMDLFISFESVCGNLLLNIYKAQLLYPSKSWVTSLTQLIIY